MKSLYLRIYLTVVAVVLSAAVSGSCQRHLEQERVRVEGLVSAPHGRLGRPVCSASVDRRRGAGG